MRFNGERVRQITLQQKEVTYDAANQPIEDWDNNDITLYAEKWERQGKESDSDGALIAQQDIRWKMRWRDINKSDYRIKEGNTVYDIENIQEIGRKEAMWLMTKVRDNQ